MSSTLWANTEYDQDVTPEVIFGSGNGNGYFTTVRINGIEIGLRPKVPTVGNVNSTGDGRYHYSLADTDHDNNPGSDNRWNFDWAINTDFDNSSGAEISDYSYELGMDADPGEGVNYLKFDPVTPTLSVPFYDHSFGTNATVNGGGQEAGDENTYLSYLNTKNVLQQSWRYSFFPAPPLDSYDPTIPGTYNVYLLVKDGNGGVIARNEIVVVIEGLAFDDNVTPDVIYGSGNANGDFTIDRKAAVEVGLRAKIPFNGNVNSNGDGTYYYTLAETDHDNNPGTDNRWNFDWSVNTNYDGSGVENIDDYTYEMGLDADPGLGTNYLTFDPITPTVDIPYYDHAIGDNTTGNGGGTVATDGPGYVNLIANNNVAQNSWRYGFFPISPLDSYDPNVPGTYSVYLSVKDSGGFEIARSEIQVLIEGAPANSIPQSTADYYVTNEDVAITAAASVLNNDTDADGQTLTVVDPGSYTANGIGGEINILSDGSFNYTPPQDVSGVDTFSYLVTDGTNEVGTELTITVNPSNDAPDFSIGGDVLVSSLADNSDLVVFDNFTYDYVFGPVDESGQSVSQFDVTVSSDSDGIIQQALVTNDGFLVIEFTTNLGTALLDVIMQDDGGTANGGNDTSMSKSFSVSFLDIIYKNGFDVEDAISILSFLDGIELISADKNFMLSTMDRPFYDVVSNSVYFFNHRFSLQDISSQNKESNVSIKAALLSWMNEVIVKENLPIIIAQ